MTTEGLGAAGLNGFFSVPFTTSNSRVRKKKLGGDKACFRCLPEGEQPRGRGHCEQERKPRPQLGSAAAARPPAPGTHGRRGPRSFCSHFWVITSISCRVGDSSKVFFCPLEEQPRREDLELKTVFLLFSLGN